MTRRGPMMIAVSLAAAAGVHLAVFPGHVRESLVHGTFFAAAAIVQGTLAVAVARRPFSSLLRTVAAVNGAMIGLWAVSRTTGLPFGPESGIAEQVGFADSITVLFEIAAIAGAAVLLRRPSGRVARRSRFAAAGVVAAVMLATAGIASATPIGLDRKHRSAAHAGQEQGRGSYAGSRAGNGDHMGGGSHDHGGALRAEGASLHGLRQEGDFDPGRDPSRTAGSPIDGTAVRVGVQPVAIAGGDGSVWVANRGDATVSRIDPASRRVIATVGVAPQPAGIAYGFGAVWVASYGRDVVQRIDPVTNAVDATVRVGVGPSAIVAARSGIWVATVTEGTVQRVDPMTLRAGAPIATGYGPVALAVDENSMWVSNALDRTVVRVDSSTGRVGAPIPVPAGAAGITSAYGSIWVTGATAGTLTRIDRASGRADPPIRVDDRSLPGLGPSDVVAAAGRLWVANNHDKTIVAVDPVAGAAGRILFFDNHIALYPGQVRLVEAAGALWVTNFEGDAIIRVPIPEGNVR